MKTEDIRATELAITPYLTLILFSTPANGRAENTILGSSIHDAPPLADAVRKPGVGLPSARGIAGKKSAARLTGHRPWALAVKVKNETRRKTMKTIRHTSQTMTIFAMALTCLVLLCGVAQHRPFG